MNFGSTYYVVSSGLNVFTLSGLHVRYVLYLFLPVPSWSNFYAKKLRTETELLSLSGNLNDIFQEPVGLASERKGLRFWFHYLRKRWFFLCIFHFSSWSFGSLFLFLVSTIELYIQKKWKIGPVTKKMANRSIIFTIIKNPLIYI